MKKFAIKLLVQEIFKNEGMPGVISFIESHEYEPGNSLYPGKVVKEWLKELKQLSKKEQVQEVVRENFQEGDER